MADLLYFTPDPNIADSDVLGYGDLVYSDGQTRYVSDDPEIVSGLPPVPPGMSPQGSLGMGPPAPGQGGMMGPPEPPIIESEQGPLTLDQMGNLKPYEGVQDPNTGELLDPGEPSRFPQALAGEVGNALQGYPNPLGQAWESEMGGTQQAPAQGGAQPVTYLDQSTGQEMTIDPTGNLKPGGGGIPVDQLAQQMQPVQREGALPADVAARQLGELGAAQAQTYGAAEQARTEEERIMREATIKQMALNEAERHRLAQENADNEARIERWRAEQRATADMDISNDLVSARGPIGAGLLALGAALLGGAGNDAGFRMMERDIEQHVRQQLSRRDTRIGLLAQQIGSAEQALRLGKAELYKAMSTRVELLAAQTKNDVFEAQSPAILAKLHELQVKEMQEAERLSLGKTLEKVPLPAKPPSPELMQKYGELRRTRQTDSGIGQRAERELGLVWDPKKQDFINKREILADGIQGIGALEQWVPNAVYSTLGGTTAEGYQVRGAAEAMAFAQLKQMQPTGIPTQKDIEGAVRAGAYNTEEGFIEALRRMRVATEEQRQHDAAEFGDNVVTEYERRYQAAGGQTQTSSPTALRPATPAEARAGAQQARGGEQPQAAAGAGANPEDPEERRGMLSDSLYSLGNEKGIPPEGLNILLAQAGHETADFTRLPQNNFFGMKSSGRNRAAGAGTSNLETTEGAGYGARRVRQDFATFSSPAAAAADMLSLLERRYPLALEALQMGDPDAYVAALKDGGYFTGDEAGYRNGILRRL
jgi:flagellum-specific peptidoglycan hydrolase FlgJ